MMQIALTIAGSDPTGGAGLQLDLRVFQAHGVHGAAVPSALTVQDTTGIQQVLPVFPSVMNDQLRVLLRDLRPDAIKLGMLASDDVLRAVQLGLEALGPDAPPLVIDPVLAASDGTLLLARRAWPGLRNLIGSCGLVTPNLPEAAELTGLDVSTRSGVESAARKLVEELGAQAALVKGGHREGPPDDCLFLEAEATWLAGERLPGSPVHGTGCALAAAVTARLAQGKPLRSAVDAARHYVRRALSGAVAAGRGARLLALPAADADPALGGASA
jgi:hydroxymethylpyrimidine/phosphomethylpyrimidine kinase